MIRHKFFALSMLALAACLWPAITPYADAGPGGGHGGGHGGGGYGHGGGGYGHGGGGYGHGGGGYGHGYGGGYGHGYGGGYGHGYGGGYGHGYGGFGLGGFGLGGLGLGDYSGYGGYGHGIGYGGYGSGYGSGYSSGYVTPSIGYSYPNEVGPTITQSMYAAPEEPNNSALIRVYVPTDAKVWIADQPTSKTGSEREFASPGLTPGKTYSYQVKARWMHDGKPVEQTQKVRIRANETTNVTFGE